MSWEIVSPCLTKKETLPRLKGTATKGPLQSLSMTPAPTWTLKSTASPDLGATRLKVPRGTAIFESVEFKALLFGSLLTSIAKQRSKPVPQAEPLIGALALSLTLTNFKVGFGSNLGPGKPNWTESWESEMPVWLTKFNWFFIQTKSKILSKPHWIIVSTQPVQNSNSSKLAPPLYSAQPAQTISNSAKLTLTFLKQAACAKIHATMHKHKSMKFTFFNKTSYPKEEVNCIEIFPFISVPWSD